MKKWRYVWECHKCKNNECCRYVALTDESDCVAPEVCPWECASLFYNKEKNEARQNTDWQLVAKHQVEIDE